MSQLRAGKFLSVDSLLWVVHTSLSSFHNGSLLQKAQPLPVEEFATHHLQLELVATRLPAGQTARYLIMFDPDTNELLPQVQYDPAQIHSDDFQRASFSYCFAQHLLVRHFYEDELIQAVQNGVHEDFLAQLFNLPAVKYQLGVLRLQLQIPDQTGWLVLTQTEAETAAADCAEVELEQAVVARFRQIFGVLEQVAASRYRGLQKQGRPAELANWVAASQDEPKPLAVFWQLNQRLEQPEA